MTVGEEEDADGEEKMPDELTKALRARGYEDGDRASVIVQ